MDAVKFQCPSGPSTCSTRAPGTQLGLQLGKQRFDALAGHEQTLTVHLRMRVRQRVRIDRMPSRAGDRFLRTTLHDSTGAMVVSMPLRAVDRFQHDDQFIRNMQTTLALQYPSGP